MGGASCYVGYGADCYMGYGGQLCGRIEMVCSQEAMGDCVGSCEWVGNRV